MIAKISTRSQTGRTLGLAAAFLLAVGCGSAGQDGPPGPDGPQGPLGPDGEQGVPGDPGQGLEEIDSWNKLIVSIGGQAALDGLTGFTIEGSGMRKLIGEGLSFDEPSAATDQFDITTHMDLTSDNLRVDWARNILFVGGFPLNYSEIVNGDLGHVDGDDSFFGPAASTTDMPSARWAAVRKQSMLLNPHALLAMINADPSLVSEGQSVAVNGVVHETLVVQDDVYPITLVISPNTGRLVKLMTVENDHLYRDVALEVTYDEWAPASNGGAMYPMAVTLWLNGQVFHEEYRTNVVENPAFTTEFDFPGGANPMYDEAAAMWGMRSHQFLQGFNGLGIPQNVEQLAVVETALEPNVYFLGGSSHNSMAIEQETGVVIIEPPLYPERGEAILAWVAANIGKPVTHVVITHHHMDHAAGVRAFIAAGATVVVGAASAGHIAQIANRPSTVVADNQAMNPQPLNIDGVPGGFGSVAILSNPPFPNMFVVSVDTGHANDMVMVYVDTGAGTYYIFQSDMFNPDSAGVGQALFPPYAQDLLDSINLFGLNQPGTTLVGGHGDYAPLTQLVDFLNPPAH